MTDHEPTLDEAIDNIEKSVEYLVDVQWKLYELGTLSPTVYDGLFLGTVDLMTVLMEVSPARGIALTDKLMNKRVDKDTNDVVAGFEKLLRGEQ